MTDVFSEFCTLLDIQNKSGDTQKLILNEQQVEFCNRRSCSGRDIVIKAHQTGFTTMELARDLFTAIDQADSLVLVVFETYWQYKWLVSALKKMSSSLPLRWAADRVNDTTWLVTGNGSKLKLVDSESALKTIDHTVVRVHMVEPEAYQSATFEDIVWKASHENESAEILIESTLDISSSALSPAESRFVGYCKGLVHADGWCAHLISRNEIGRPSQSGIPR